MTTGESADRRHIAPALLVPTGEALRGNNFDAIRLAMALLVVWSHAFALFVGDEAAEPIGRATNGFYNAGNIGVLTFFTISGFLITLSFERSRSILTYFRRRVARIHPGYLVAITLCSLVVVPAFSSLGWGVDRAEAEGLASNLLLRNYIRPSDAFGHGIVNGSLWSIPYEFWCYIAVAGLGVSGLLRRRWPVLAIALAVMAARSWLDATGRMPGGGMIQTIIGFQYLWFVVLPSFLWGAILYLYRARVPRWRGLALAAIVGTLACAHLPLGHAAQTLATRLVFPPALAYLTLYAAFSRRVRLHGAARFGDFSYGTYLYAFPIQQILWRTLGDRLGFWPLLGLAMLLSLAAGVASWHLIERWFLPRIRHGRAQRAEPPLKEEAALVAP